MTPPDWYRKLKWRLHLVLYAVVGAIAVAFIVVNSQLVVVRIPGLGELRSPAWVVVLFSGLLGAGVLKLVQLIRRIRQP